VITLLTLLILAATLAFAILAMAFILGSHTNENAKGPINLNKDEMKKFIFWKIFYVNPNDPRGWVPKTWGLGWTINFRTKKMALLFALLLASFFVSILLFSAHAVEGI